MLYSNILCSILISVGRQQPHDSVSLLLSAEQYGTDGMGHGCLYPVLYSNILCYILISIGRQQPHDSVPLLLSAEQYGTDGMGHGLQRC